MTTARQLAHRATYISLITLIFQGIFWEGYWAPLHTHGSFLILKTLPLLFFLKGVLQGHRKTFQWGTLLIWPYVTEGIMRGMTESGVSAYLAWGEVGLSTLFFISASAYARLSSPRPLTKTLMPMKPTHQ